MYIGFIVAVAFVPGFTGAAMQTQWAVLSMLLPLALWRNGEMTFFHWSGVAFLVYAFVSLFWTFDQYDGVYGLWLLTMIGLAFWLGSTLPTLRPIYTGLAFGLTISSVVAVIQWLGYDPVLRAPWSYPSGLFYNSAVLGAVMAMVVVGLTANRLYYLIPGLLPGLVLSHSRAGILAAGIGILLAFRLWIVALVLVIIGLQVTIYLYPIHDLDRFQILVVAWKGLSLWGYGPGSFLGVFYQTAIGLKHPEHVHNDFLQLAFEFGIGSVLLFAPIAFALCRTKDREWPTLVAFVVLAAFSFPLYLPITACLGALVTGRIIRGWSMARVGIDNSGPSVLPWNEIRQWRMGEIRS